MIERGILQSPESFLALIRSLESTEKWTPDQSVFSFLDNCIGRIAQKPVRYLDMLESAQQHNSDKKPLSLLACCVSEQWPFVGSSGDEVVMENTAQWIMRFFSALEQVDENLRVILQLKEDMLRASIERTRPLLKRVFEEQPTQPAQTTPVCLETDGFQQQRETIQQADPTLLVDLVTTFGRPNPPITSLSSLSHWTIADLDTMIPTGRCSRLLHALSSPESEIRISGFSAIQSLISLLATSTSIYAAAQQLHLLLGELLETVRSKGLTQPLPTVVPEFAALFARILHDPADRMYGKVNRFLLKAPHWDLDRILTYWMSKTLLTEPETDDGHHLEVDRLLQTLMNGLRTPEDVEVYRRAGVWERVCALALTRGCTFQARRRVLGIVWRTMEVTGGKEMLIRRAGIRGWLMVMKTRTEGEDRRIVEALLQDLKVVEESEEIKEWRKRMPLLKEKNESRIRRDQDEKVSVEAG